MHIWYPAEKPFQKQPPEMFYKKADLKIWQYSQENTCLRVSNTKEIKDTLTQVFSCEYYEIFKNT